MGKDVFKMLVMGIVGFMVLSIFVSVLGVCEGAFSPAPPPDPMQEALRRDLDTMLNDLLEEQDEPVIKRSLAPGAFNAEEHAQPVQSAEPAASPLLLAGVGGVLVFAVAGTIGLLLLWKTNEPEVPELDAPAADAPQAEAPRAPAQTPAGVSQTLTPASAQRASPPPAAPASKVIGADVEEPMFDEYGRPADYVPVALEGYYRNLAFTLALAGLVGVLLCTGRNWISTVFYLATFFE